MSHKANKFWVVPPLLKVVPGLVPIILAMVASGCGRGGGGGGPSPAPAATRGLPFRGAGGAPAVACLGRHGGSAGLARRAGHPR